MVELYDKFKVFNPIPALDKYICFRVFAQHTSTCWAACVQTLCMIMVKHKLFLETIFSVLLPSFQLFTSAKSGRGTWNRDSLDLDLMAVD